MKNGRELILIVDGGGEEKDSVGTLLREEHFQVVTMGDGQEALDYLKEDPYRADLIIASLELPSLTGMELLKKLKATELTRQVPVVLLMDSGQLEERSQAMDNGAEDVIMRPFDKRIVANRIYNTIMTKGRPQSHNVMEEMAEIELDHCIDSLGICKCIQCRQDVLTLALNRLKPRYVLTGKGRMYASLDQMTGDYLPELYCALTESAEVVKKNPRHTYKPKTDKKA